MIDATPAPVSEGSVLAAFDLIGVWALPGSSALHSGRLSYDKNDIILTIMELANIETAFQKMSDRASEKVDTICGVIETGEHVLLDRCFGFKSQFIMNQSEPWVDHEGNKIPGGVSAIRRTTYRAKAMYVSKVPIPSRPASAMVSVSYTSLFTWLNNYAINTNINKESATITFVPPRRRKISLPGGLFLTLSYGHTIRQGVPEKEFVLPQSASIIFEASSPVEIGWFHPYIIAFANFLMMGTKLPIQPETYVMWRGKDAVMAFPEYVIYSIPSKEEDLLGMHFNYQQIAGSFDNVLRHWFAMSKKYEKSMQLYFQTRLVAGRQDAEVRFLRLAQALEAFYRAKYPSAERSISRMLEDIVRELPYDIFPGQKERSSFIAGMSAARNYFSHGFLPNKKQSVPMGNDLSRMTERAEVLLYGCYLHELEIGDDLKASIMKKRVWQANSIEYL